MSPFAKFGSSSEPGIRPASYPFATSGKKLVKGISLLLWMALCVFLLPARPAAAQTGDTPIKVRGGSTAFFSENPWTPLPRKVKPAYCTAIKASDLGTLVLENFFPVSIQDFRRREVKRVEVPLTTQTWRIEIFGHHEKETAAALQLSTDGIALQASPRGCTSREDTASIQISPLGKASFYPLPDLIAAGRYSGNKRFLSKCSSLHRDRCERIAEVHIFDAGSTRPRVFTCPDGECTLYIGKGDEEADRSKTTSPPR